MITDPETLIHLLKICAVANLVIAFLQWHREKYGTAKFFSCLTLVNMLLIIGVHYYGQI